jgi:hypothetical protein
MRRKLMVFFFLLSLLLMKLVREKGEELTYPISFKKDLIEEGDVVSLLFSTNFNFN